MEIITKTKLDDQSKRAFWKALEIALNKTNHTLKELADELGLTQSAISQWRTQIPKKRSIYISISWVFQNKFDCPKFRPTYFKEYRGLIIPSIREVLKTKMPAMSKYNDINRDPAFA